MQLDLWLMLNINIYSSLLRPHDWILHIISTSKVFIIYILGILEFERHT